MHSNGGKRRGIKVNKKRIKISKAFVSGSKVVIDFLKSVLRN